MDIGGYMVSAASGPGGYFPPRPINPNQQKGSQINQTVHKAGQIHREAMQSSSGAGRPSPEPPAEEKGFFKSAWDKLTSIF